MLPQWVALAIGIAGLGGLVFAALRFNRDDSTAVVQQQSTVLHDMQAINSELRLTNEELKVQVRELRDQIQEMRRELRNGRDP